jgi:predicted chitinase
MNNLTEITVRNGDTLTRIAKRHDTTVAKILSLNPDIEDPNQLSVGQIIHINPSLGKITLTFKNRDGFAPIGIAVKVTYDTGKKVELKISTTANSICIQPSTHNPVKIYAQLIGKKQFNKIGAINPKQEDSSWALKIFSIKVASKTDQHPQDARRQNTKRSELPNDISKKSAASKDIEQGIVKSPALDNSNRPLQVLLAGPCACDRDITLAELSNIYPHQKESLIGKFLPHINEACKSHQITSCIRKSHFLAQVGHESGRLRFTAEILQKGVKESDVYDGYKGRGLIQLTYKKNYAAYGEAAKEDFLGSNRTKLETEKWASDSAGWFWTSGSARDLNELADKNDLLAISAYINGAFNGFEDRREIFALAHKSLGAEACKNTAIKTSVFLPFEKSAVFNSRDLSFAWGCWNDPTSKKEGVKKNEEQKKAGYNRFLILDEQTPAKKRRKRFGYSIEKMVEMAQKGSK